jgi:stage III sporulation protein AE
MRQSYDETVATDWRGVADALPDWLTVRLPAGVRAALEQSGSLEDLAAGTAEMSSPGFWHSLLRELGGTGLRDALRLLARIVLLLVLSAVLNALRGSLAVGDRGRGWSILCAAVILAGILELQLDSLRAVKVCLDRLNGFSCAMLPLMGTLYALGGNLQTAVVSHASFSLFLTLSELFCNRTVLPFCALSLVLSLADTFTPGARLRALAGWIRKTYTSLLSFASALLLTVLALQTTLSKAADSLGARTVKFLAASAIPVLGGTVAEPLRTVSGSVAYLRSVSGTAGILLLLLLVLPTFLSLLLNRWVLSLGAAVAELLGCGEEGRLLGEMGALYGHLLGVVSLCAVYAVFSLTLLVRCAAVGA